MKYVKVNSIYIKQILGRDTLHNITIDKLYEVIENHENGTPFYLLINNAGEHVKYRKTFFLEGTLLEWELEKLRGEINETKI